MPDPRNTSKRRKETGHLLRLRFNDEWRRITRRPFEVRLDRRELMCLYHPWEPSKAGRSAKIERTVTVPADWQPPYLLHFYCSDDYHADGCRVPPDSWSGQISLIGHRFKQALIDGKVIWEVDVADAEGPEAVKNFSLDLTPHIEAGIPFRLAFRVIDKVASDERLPMDYRHIGATEREAIKESDPWKFMTHVYIGDVVLVDATCTESLVGRRPSSLVVEKRHGAEKDFPPYGDDILPPITLTLEAPGGIPPDGSPVTCGVPLPRGAVRDVNTLSLKDPRGRRVPLQTEVMNSWEDGSVRWALLDFVAKGVKDGSKFRMGWDAKAKEGLPEHAVLVRDDCLQPSIASDALSVEFGRGPRCFGVSIHFPNVPQSPDAAILSEMHLDRDGVSAWIFPNWEEVRVIASGPVRATVEVKGNLTELRRTVEGGSMKVRTGRFVLRIDAYAGLPHLRLSYRVFNETDEALAVKLMYVLSGWRLTDSRTWQVAWTHDETRSLSGAGTRFWLEQHEPDLFTLRNDTGEEVLHGERLEGWLARGDAQRTHLIAVRHFRQQLPKVLVATWAGSDAHLFSPSKGEPYYQPAEGEAKRHEILLAFMPEALDPKKCSAIAKAFQNPPRLFDAEHFCKYGGFDHAHPRRVVVNGRRTVLNQFRELDDFMRKTYGDAEPEQFYEFGIRNFGDRRYGKTGNVKPQVGSPDDLWCNNYYDSMHGYFSEYLMTGDRRWFDHLEATARHVMDIDTCHASAAHPEWVGSWHGYNGPNHSTAPPWSAMQRTGGMIAYWRLTGDVDARDNAIGVADFILRTDFGLGSTSSRDHAGVLMTATMAYDETRDPKYLALARRLAHDAISRMDLRRGCYSEVHGNHSYRGNVPWMDAQLAEPLFYYYRQSGDVLAADAVVGLAESIIAENMTPGVPGDIYGYSHNPHFGKNSNYHILIAPTLCYAYELTSDKEFLSCARAAYKQTIREGTVNHIQNCYWNTPALLYYLKRERARGTK